MKRHTGQTTRDFSFIASTLPGWADVGVLRAAARSGATAVLNLEALTAAEIRASFTALTLNQPGRIGVRVDAAPALDPLHDLLAAIDVAIIAIADRTEQLNVVERLRAYSCQLLIECAAADEARLGADVRATGVIAKGHESGGRVGDETTFVLVQRLLAEAGLPVYAHGGIGIHTVGACFVAGCAGVVLDAQLALARESTLPGALKTALGRMEGDETACLGGELDARYRVYRRPGFPAVDELQRQELELSATGAPDAEKRRRWREAIHERINLNGVGAPLWPLGQDAALARTLAGRFRSVSGILAGLSEAAIDHVTIARQLRPLDRGAPLAQAHRTEYPILQGPMTRVSDTATFAAAVAAGGGLPFLALALLRGPQVRSLLGATKALLGDCAWGVGVLGFVPNELREEQLRVIEEFAPPFALIAGGRPDQAAKLERHGIPTYLHVPAPSLLRMFVDEGARRFVFEGRECGGHVGPRTSFVLWESMVETLVDVVTHGVPASEFHVVFAGGIHDAVSAAMVATIAAPLAKLGARVGVLMGSAYLFTEEAVATGAIVEAFQEEALKCSRTVLLESGPGHATRCADTPFFETFRETRRELIGRGESAEDIRRKLEALNLGRLRIASKGVVRVDDGHQEQADYVSVGKDDQRAEGMYMIGQVAALRHRTCRISDLHHEVAVGGTAVLYERAMPPAPALPEPPAAAIASQIAIVGMGCLLPHASDASTLWSQILGKADAIVEIPRDRFDADQYFNPDRQARDTFYSKWGGFLGEIAFDPTKYGIPPAAVPSIDPFQLLTLEVVYQAIRDAGYSDRPFNRDRTSVVLGASGGSGELGFRYGIRAGLPMYLDPVPDDIRDRLPEWTEDSFAGMLLNVAAGRVANRLDLGGLNFTVDAACASSLAAVYVAARELESCASDVAIVGGVDTTNSPFGFLCFGSAQALSPTGRCRTFDDAADGIAISEGLAALVLKRVADAERDGDRIYAVIRAVAGSSDGRGKGLTAPRPEGQVRVLERAYAAAGFSARTVGLIEAHGTGTVAGDTAEVTALARVFEAAGAAPASCALGSIKSMIGHTKSAAGVSGLLKVSLALYHKVLPPTLHVTRPIAKLQEAGTPFFVNTEARPWIASCVPEAPRRAAVSSFGFGGTNFHVVVEEYDRNGRGALPEAACLDAWPAELAYWTSPHPEQLLAALQQLDERLACAPHVPLPAVAKAICRAAAPSASGLRLAIVAASVNDLRERLTLVCEALRSGKTHLSDGRGVYLSDEREPTGKVAFLFPGQGSQYPDMFRELSVCFPEMRHALELADRATSGQFARPLSTYVFPPPAFSDDEAARQARELTETDVAQTALGSIESGLCDLLRRFGVLPDMTAGHSYGEYVALSVAGAFPADVLVAISAARGRVIKAAAGDRPGTMAAVTASPEAIARVLGEPAGVWLANMNSPRQTVLAGQTDAVEDAVATLSASGLPARKIPVACAFHSPLVEAAGRHMADLLEQTDIGSPAVPVFSNTLGGVYPAEPRQIKAILAGHIAAPVRFVEQIEAMFREGARVFVEVGPRSVLSNLARETLSGRGAVILPLDAPEQRGVTQLLHGVAQLAAAGVPIDFEELWRGRTIQPIDLARLRPAEPLPRHVWMVSGGRARRSGETAVEARPRTAAPAAAAASPAPEAPPAEASRLPVSHGGPMHPDSQEPRADHPADGSSDVVIRQFQQLMSQFLHTQALVMTAYLQGVQADGASAGLALAPLPPQARARPAAPIVPDLSPLVAASPVAAAPMVVPAVPPAAAPTPEMVPRAASPVVAVSVPPPAAEPVASVPPEAMSAAEVLRQLLRIISDRTGYPEEMLEPDANIEADLGIDSIKRLEILTAFQQLHSGAQRGVFQGAMEKLTTIKTLRETASVLAALLTGQAEAAVA
jgi:acyl transferase domain-containing protein/NAD(P)H-dependent flavin oxidoreductase YrpB (nitropropane dioxygenase family)